jgi:DNA-binding Xre family transcriptional regulator
MNLNKKRMVEILEEQDISLTDVAMRMGCSRQNFNVIFNRGSCNFKTVLKIADALNVPASELVEGPSAMDGGSKVCPISKVFCARQNCAWWMPDNGCCAIATLAASAAVVSDALSTEIQVVNYEGS